MRADAEGRLRPAAADATFENVGGGPDSVVGGEKYGGGDIWFRETAVAGDATFTNRGSVEAVGRGGRLRRLARRGVEPGGGHGPERLAGSQGLLTEIREIGRLRTPGDREQEHGEDEQATGRRAVDEAE
jgi:hypothetical protein